MEGRRKVVSGLHNERESMGESMANVQMQRDGG